MSALEGNNDRSSGAVPSEAVNAPESITAARLLCTNSFNRLIELLRDSDLSTDIEPYISAELIESQLEGRNDDHASRLFDSQRAAATEGDLSY